MGQSRKLILTNWAKANNALNQYFEGNKSKLAESRRISRTVVTEFFQERAVGEPSFRKICLALRLNWEEVSSFTKQSHFEPAPDDCLSNSAQENFRLQNIEILALQNILILYIQELEFHLENLIKPLKDHCRQTILNQHSRMKFLSGKEIRIDHLYVDVWFLEKPESRYFNTSKTLLDKFDIENDRLALSKRIRRNSGFEVAIANSKLVVLGKPGAGKTTFLKNLAMDWCKGKFYSDLLAVMIEFRKIQDENWNLLEAIGKELDLDDGYSINTCILGIKELKAELNITSDINQKIKIEQEIEQLKQRIEYFPLQVILKQGKLLILMDGLDEVPTNWMRQKVQDQLKELIKEYQQKNRFIMTCRTQVIQAIPEGFSEVEVADFDLVQVREFVQNWFSENGEVSVSSTEHWELLKKAVSCNPALKELIVTPILLSLTCLVLQDEGKIPSDINWLYMKGIKLLLRKWNDYKDINDWEIGNETYRKLSVEQKESLLIEIAARKFENPDNFVLFQQEEISSCIAQILRLDSHSEGISILKAIEAQHGLLVERADELWSFSHLTFQEHFTLRWLTQLSVDQLTDKITNPKWQEVVRQLVKSQQPADRLLRLIKQATDQILIQETKLQDFLNWILQESKSIQTPYKPAYIRAFYFSLALKHDVALDYDCDIVLELALDLALNRPVNFENTLWEKLKHLRIELPKPSQESWRDFQQWWYANRTKWFEQLCQLMIKDSNIGTNSQFTDSQIQKLKLYYQSNKFLIDLMKVKGAISNKVRVKIEEAILLPWTEI